MPDPAFFQTLERLHSADHGGLPILDPDVIGTLLELGGDDPTELIVELVELYLEDVTPRVEDMRAAHGRGDVQAVGAAAHALKSASANIGAVNFSRVCREIETSSRSGARAEDLQEPMRAFDSMLDEVRAALGDLREACR